MYIPVKPVGVNPISREDRKPIWTVTNGDNLELLANVKMSDGTPATPTNSILTFVLAETRFCQALWTGVWRSGIESVDGDAPGLVKIHIPDSVGKSLRRGGYSFSMTLSDLYGDNERTILVGNMLMEYEPTSPNKNIPYKEDNGLTCQCTE